MHLARSLSLVFGALVFAAFGATAAQSFTDDMIISGNLEVRGFTQCLADLELSFATVGRIEYTHVEEGDTVAKGDILIELDQSVEQMDVERRRLQWENKSELIAAEVRRDTARIQFEAARDIYQRSGGISLEEVQNREMAYKLSLAELERLHAAEAMEELDYKTAAENIRRRTLYAPAEGIVTALLRQTGESAQANDPVLKLCDLSRIVFVANVPVDIAEVLVSGDSARVRVGSRGVTVDGRVRFVSPVIDPASGLCQVKVDLIDPPANVRPGLSATLVLN